MQDKENMSAEIAKGKNTGRDKMAMHKEMVHIGHRSQFASLSCLRCSKTGRGFGRVMKYEEMLHIGHR